MDSRFFRFYLLVLIAVILVIVSFSLVYQAILSTEKDYYVSVEEIFSTVTSGRPTDYTRLSNTDIQLSDELNKQLENGQIISFTVGIDTYFLMQEMQGTYLRWGPVSTQKAQSNQYIILVLFSMLAIVFLLVFRPLFRDISYLQKCAVEFTENPKPQPLKTSRSSSVYPLASTLYDMANRLHDIVEQNRDIARIIAHEVRTPLARMRFVLKRIEGDIATKHNTRMLQDIAEIEKIADEYLEYSRSQLIDKHYIEAQPILKFVSDIAKKYKGLPVKLETLFKQASHQLYCNPVQLELALTNVLNNAFKYANKHICLSVSESPSHIVIMVEDDGVGFDKAHMAKLNEGTAVGFGLGLYISSKILNRHNGNLLLGRSHLGGAAVTFEIPKKLSKS
ncbi:sensor histidine kinase [Thalassotalea agarivorans]|uniref:histidine kinase n=1 Tax=Thalassotalea agarivorans TaxID=349064 RepID=A0A1I0CXE3_THASX|nr:HAMP domain-containing sensor histidine kinase [Thalassotalea agarivorans]SET24434.1 two-component system, OmpR family, sensor kinase [Thalassotalea agarivorans]